ncbi:MAG: thiol protease/hemagglutinin PrtT [Bacteroidales bacterium]|nr:thiol protease/hemagglutinin PrtT [Bacteroidales bacterium]
MKTHARFALNAAIVAVLMFGNVAKADNVDVQKAQKVAARFVMAQTGAKTLGEESVSLVYQVPNTIQNIPALHVFNVGDRGFVVVSGSESIDPVLIYSNEGSLDPNNIPPDLAWWINGWAEPVVVAQNEGLEPTEEVQAMWDELGEEGNMLPTPGKAVSFLLTSKWSQDGPYNNDCPTISGTRAPVGCVATAMSQIMYFWKYPVVGKGQSSYYHRTVGTLSANYGETVFDWANMADQLAMTSSRAAQKAVSTLNYAVGVSVKMDYGEDGSGVPSGYVGNRLSTAFRTYFKYDAGLRYITRDSYENDSAFVDSVRNEILAGRPVFYTGFDSSSNGPDAGHAFVCDGYDASRAYFHFNWGWGGSGDCWSKVYRPNVRLRPNGNGFGYNFSAEHQAALHVQPPQDTLNARLLAVESAEADELMAAFPNPAHNVISIPYRLHNDGSATLQIYTIDGRLVESRPLVEPQGAVRISLDGYNKGIYIYRLNGSTRKFVVQ